MTQKSEMTCHDCEQEKDKPLNAYFQDQTIAPDGKLRPTFSRLVERADKAEAELSRLTALLEDRTKLAEELMKHGLVGLQEVMAAAMSGDAQSYGNTRNTPGLAYQLTKQSALALADRLIAYLKGKE